MAAATPTPTTVQPLGPHLPHIHLHVAWHHVWHDVELGVAAAVAIGIVLVAAYWALDRHDYRQDQRRDQPEGWKPPPSRLLVHLDHLARLSRRIWAHMSVKRAVDRPDDTPVDTPDDTGSTADHHPGDTVDTPVDTPADIPVKVTDPATGVTRVTDDTADLVVELAAEGMSLRAIAAGVGLHHSTVANILRRHQQPEHLNPETSQP